MTVDKKYRTCFGCKSSEKSGNGGVSGIYQQGLQKAVSPNLPHGGLGGAGNWDKKVRKTTVFEVKTVVFMVAEGLEPPTSGL